MTITDILILVGLFIFSSSGAYSGVLRAAINPLVFGLSALLSWAVLLISKNLFFSLASLSLGSFLFGWILSKALYHFQSRNTIVHAPSPTSRLAGFFVNLCWGSVMAGLIVAGLAMAPFERYGYSDISNDIFHSKSYDFIEPFLVPEKRPAQKTVECPSQICPEGDKDSKDLFSSPEMQELMSDPRIQKMLNDPAFQDALTKKDFVRIMSHPIIQELRQDPVFMLRTLRANALVRAKSRKESSLP